jgi:hypothetical protein
MQGFSIESKTSGISSSSTMWQDLEARYKSCNETNMTPRSPGTELEKMTNSEDLVRKVSNLAGQSFIQFREKLTTRSHMQKGEWSRRLGNQRRAKEAADWGEMGQAGRPSPFRGPVGPLFDLDASRAIYRPLTESHASINSSSAAEEQRSLRDTISKRRSC